MKTLGLISYQNISAPNGQRLLEAASQRGLKVEVLAPHELVPVTRRGGSEVLVAGTPKTYDFIVHRTCARFAGIIRICLSIWKDKGALVLNDFDHAMSSRDKLQTSYQLHRLGLPAAPAAGFVPGSPHFKVWDEIDKTVFKPAHGYRGEGVAKGLVPSQRHLTESSTHVQHWISQPVFQPIGQDIRAFVVNNQCVAMMRRIAHHDEFRANLSLGGTSVPLSPSGEFAELAVLAVRSLDLDYAGVDMMLSNRNLPVITEIDAWAGFVGLEGCTGVDIAGHILELTTLQSDHQ